MLGETIVVLNNATYFTLVYTQVFFTDAYRLFTDAPEELTEMLFSNGKRQPKFASHLNLIHLSL